MKATRAKLFQNGGSQVVRLPKECRFTAQGEVLVRRKRHRVILEAANEWSDTFRACLGAWRGQIPGRSNSASVICVIPSPDAAVHAGHVHGEFCPPWPGTGRDTLARTPPLHADGAPDVLLSPACRLRGSSSHRRPVADDPHAARAGRSHQPRPARQRRGRRSRSVQRRRRPRQDPPQLRADRAPLPRHRARPGHGRLLRSLRRHARPPAGLGPIAEYQGLYADFGWSGHGFKHSRVIGDILSDVVLHGVAEGFDLTPFRWSRFRATATSCRGPGGTEPCTPSSAAGGVRSIAMHRRREPPVAPELGGRGTCQGAPWP